MNNGMIGAIVGDIAGARFEWHNQKWILVGTAANATRKLRVVRLGLRQMDGIGFRLFGNLENQSKSCFHSFAVSSEARELLLNEFHIRDLIIPHVWCSILTNYNL
ncbi:MAG: hypothetical protein E7046_03690 [Lentisphaerae bacterium]|nr:hypothetical protein [Lentisphaerota bacterium]